MLWWWPPAIVTAAIFVALTTPVFAASPCEPVVGRLVAIEGRVEFQRARDSSWQPAVLEGPLCQGDSIRVSERSRAAVALSNQAVLRLDENTTIQLVNVAAQPEERSLLSLVRGALQSFSRKPRRFEVSTPYLNGSIEGTEFVFRVLAEESILTVLEGRVLAANDRGKLAVSAGEAVAAQRGAAPAPRTLVRPRDAAQWSLHYPPILAAPQARGQAGRDAGFHLARAAQSLSVGRVAEARSDIDQALALDSKLGAAFALRAILHVVQNDREQALADARQAVALNPEATAPAIALSYAQQASFRIAEARDTMLKAIEHQPNDAFAWARLAELWLMLGHRDRAIEAATKAASFAPTLARTQNTLGFAALAEFRFDTARAAFDRAIALDSADPLPRLGLGLVKIGIGDLEAGRRELEVAVALDSNSALLRAYLGKAYFEEKRAPLDGEQLAIAKQLDPLDPTAYLYDGIRKQTENRPIEARQDVEDAIARNDNRAAYRGRLLLDKDRAARGTSLARVYNDLGFAQLGINESAQSLTIDAADASAHRFLSDTYRGVRRREIARVSELLQAQLMQDININPVQPSISETNLNIVTLGGPSSAGFDEFTPLFQRNQAQFGASLFGGSDDTRGGEAVVSALYGPYSVSVGALSHQTDGWRPNNGLDQDLYNAFVQAAVSDKLNLQVEFLHRRSTEGDLTFNFDPASFLTDKTIERERDTARFGLRYSSTPHSHFLLSYIHSDRDEALDQVELQPPDPFFGLPFTFTDNSKANDKGDQIEAQYIWQRDGLNVIMGAAKSKSDRRDDIDISVDHPIFGNVLSIDTSSETETEQPRAYAYVHIRSMDSVIWTLGASYDKYEQGTLEETSFNPKFGVQWHVANNVRLRAAAFKILKPALVNNRTLEPTQIAGFNQLFDDINGTKSRRYAGGVDWRVTRDLAAGAEATWRKLDEPTFDFLADNWIFEEREEQLHKLYLYWTPFDRIAVRTELVYDRYESESGIVTEFANLPEMVKTTSLPVGVSYFDPSGFFAGISATAVDQEVRRAAAATQASGEDRFLVADAVLGYRFGKRRGMASLEVRNLFDREFRYQDDSYREFRDEPAIGPYFPTRTLMGRITLNF